jgi:hypothetical protein
LRPSFTRYGDHEPKFWIRRRLDLGVVDVDPVVGEGDLVLGHHERHGEEVAVAEVVGGGEHLGRRRRVHGPTSRCGNGIEEMTWSAGCWVVSAPSSTAVTDTAPVAVADAGDRGLHRPWSPGASTSSRQRSHIIPGPYLGYWNSSMRLVMSFWLRLGSSAFPHGVEQRQVLDALGGPVGRISVAGTPHTFSV